MKRWILSFIVLICAVGGSIWLQSDFPNMKEAILTILGASIALGGTWLFKNEDIEKSARYLAIRLVCLFDKYIEDCVAVVRDDGLLNGSRTQDGCLSPQVASPGQPAYPDDIDWKSINHDLMYEILSFPSEIEAGDNAISFAWDHCSSPPDYDEGFEERAFQYAQFGLKAHKLAQKLRKKYGIHEKDYTDWNPLSALKEELEKIKSRQAQRAESNAKMIEETKKRTSLHTNLLLIA
ncbi:MAG: hypothetical protein KUG81_03425 [Gammaproteobacteria bacterium]|nr:hypothetical protein [Gammaproteobacteria bacterium]